MYYDEKSKRIFLHDVEEGLYSNDNTIIIENKIFYLRNISTEYRKSKGGNSSVFILHDKEGIEEDKAIKFSNFYRSRQSPDWVKRRYGRFINEIDALKKVKNIPNNHNIILIECDGMQEIDHKFFPFYVMEKADDDLKEYLLLHGNDIDFVERMKLCRDIFKGIKVLHDLDFYHRDIKPDNIFLFFTNAESEGEGRKFTWKVGDLGLAVHRDQDYDDIGEKVGPFGWLSPESMNKFLTEKTGFALDCKINNQSDIFQLGKLFWFIFQYNVPIGQIQLIDFKYEMPHKDFFFDLVKNMLQYDKNRRPTNEIISENIDLLALEYGI